MAASYLSTQAMSFPEAAGYYNDMKLMYEEKLYHQLSTKIQECLKVPFFQANDTLLQLYHGFIKHFEKNLDPVELVTIVVQASKQSKDTNASLEFLDSFKELITEEKSKEAWLLILLERAQYELDSAPSPRLADAKAKIDQARETISRYSGLSDVVHSAFYRVCLQYHKIVGTPVEYFENAKMFLSYTNVEQISEADRITLAKDIATSALIGEVYSFGELLQHDILKYLDKTDDAWLRVLLAAFNEGNILEFDAIMQQNKDKPLFKDPDAEAKLNRKIRHMKLLDLVFQRPIHDRNLKFSEIMRECILTKPHLAEELLMDSMCLNLIKGEIDQVNESVEISWLQPRMLTRTQLTNLQARLATWTDELTNVAKFLEMPAEASGLAEQAASA